MENKFNEATPQRPEGNRALDANMVVMDIDQFMEQLRKEPAWHNSDHTAITIFKSDRMRIVLIGLHEGAILPTHTANGMISVQVVEGHISFAAEQQTAELAEGQMLALHEKIPHSVTAKKESFFLLTLAVAR